MEKYNKIHQFIHKTLEEREIPFSFSSFFKNHQNLSWKFWKIVSFVLLFPLSLSNAFTSQHIIDNMLIGSQNEIPSLLLTLFHISFGLFAFFIPIFLSSILLTHILPLYKLEKQNWFRRFFRQKFRKLTSLAASCDTVNYKIEHIMKFVKDQDFNLAMSSYYTYLLDFDFEQEVKNSIKRQLLLLSDFDLNPERYSKNFDNIVFSFLNNVEHFSKNKRILSHVYQDKLDKKIFDILNEQNQSNKEIDFPIEEDNLQKKNFKDFL